MKAFINNQHIVLIIRGLVGRSGGAERIYCELANILADAGYRVTCLYFDGKDGEIFYHISHAVERINLFGKPYSRARRKAKIARLIFPKNLARAEWELENGFFISQLHDYFRYTNPAVAISLMPPANTPALLASTGTDVKVVATNHNVPAQDYDNPKRWSANSVDRELRVKALDNAAAIHVLFPEFGEWFPAHLKNRIVDIPNYVSPDFQRPDHFVHRENTILAVGRLTEVKNYLQLLRSWANIANDYPDWKVKIYGIGPQLKLMKEEIGRLGLAGRVELPGHKADLAGEYAKASVFCHPALFEGFGLSPAEALFMETPVVCYADCAGVNQFVKDGYNGLAVARESDKDELALALRRLIENESLRASLGKNGPESVSGFTIERYKNNWLNLIGKLTEAN